MVWCGVVSLVAEDVREDVRTVGRRVRAGGLNS